MLKGTADFRFRTFFIQFCTFFSGKFCCRIPHFFIVQTFTFFCPIWHLSTQTFVAQFNTYFCPILHALCQNYRISHLFNVEGHFCLASAGGAQRPGMISMCLPRIWACWVWAQAQQAQTWHPPSML